MWIADAQQIRELEAATLEALGLPSLLWMERAAAAVAREVTRLGGERANVVLLCGGGNNGGDGLAAARMLHTAGLDVSVVLAAREEALPAPARTNLDIAKRAGVRLLDPSDIGTIIAGGTVIVDALLGTGATGAPRGDIEALLTAAGDAVRASGARVVAVDIPSGLDASTGAAPGAVLHADVTVTFGMPKWGHFLGRAPDLVGRLIVEPLDIARQRAAALSPPLGLLYGVALARHDFVSPSRAAHKKTRGHVLAVGGCADTPGAIALSADAALHAGAGLVTVAGSERARDVALAHRRELMSVALDSLRSNDLGTYDAFVAGPGLGTDEAAERALNAVLDAAGDRPLVLDADALYLLARSGPRALPPGSILTPHPGELARLDGCSTDQAAADLRATAQRVALAWGATVIAKTAGAVVVADRTYFVEPGSPLMATAGAGDVLAGTVAGLAPGHGRDRAARLGTWLHAAAGRHAAARGEHGSLVAGDLVTNLGRALGELGS